jgi:hypothetical protein
VNLPPGNTLARALDGASLARLQDDAARWAAIAARNEWLAIHRGQASSHVRGLDQTAGLATADEPMTLRAAGTYEIARIALPSIARTGDSVSVLIYVSAFTTGNTRYFAKPKNGGTEVVYELLDGSNAAPSGVGWISVDVPVLDYPLRPEGFPFELLVYAVASSATNQSVGTVCVVPPFDATMADGAMPPASWPKLSLTHAGSADRPDSVGMVKRIVDQQNHVAALFPQTLVQHSFSRPVKTRAFLVSSNDDCVTLRYRVQRGPIAGDCSLLVYLQQDSNSHAWGDVAIKVFVNDDVEFGSPAVTAAYTSTSAGWTTSIVVPAAAWTANALNDVKIRVAAGRKSDGSVNGTVTVWAVVLTESAYSSSDYMVGAETAPTTWTAARWDSPVQGDPIVADFAGGAFSDQRIDRIRLASDAVLLGYRKHAVLVEDYIWRDTVSLSSVKTYQLNGAIAPYGTPTILFRTKRTPTYGTVALDVWARARRNGSTVADAGMFPRLGVWLDSTEQPDAARNIGHASFPDGAERLESSIDQNEPRWLYLGRVEVTPGTTYEVSVRAGFIGPTGDKTTTPGTDAVILDGVIVAEIPRMERP